MENSSPVHPSFRNKIKDYFMLFKILQLILLVLIGISIGYLIPRDEFAHEKAYITGEITIPQNIQFEKIVITLEEELANGTRSFDQVIESLQAGSTEKFAFPELNKSSNYRVAVRGCTVVDKTLHCSNNAQITSCSGQNLGTSCRIHGQGESNFYF